MHNYLLSNNLFFRSLSKCKHLLRRGISKAPKKYSKTQKILRYFDEHHGYTVSPDIVSLRQTITRKFQASSSPVSVTALDVKLCQQINKLDINGMLYLLNSWAAVNSPDLPRSIFYQTFLSTVRKGAFKSAEWRDLVEIIHFVGYLNGEEDSKSLMILFLHTVNEHMDLPRANYKDVCVICEAAFRTSTLVRSPAILNKISQILHNQCEEITSDSIWLVMLLKTMIFSKYLDVDLLAMLADKWAKPRLMQRMSFTARCYLMSVYAHAGLRNDKLFNVCIETIGREFDEQSSRYRLKDVAVFLWAVSSLRYNLSQQWLHQSVVPYLMSRLSLGHQKEGLNIFIKICIPLWVMNCLATPVLQKIITMETLEVIRDMKNQREMSRMAVLLDIMHAEGCSIAEQLRVREAVLSCDLMVPSIEKELERRPLLKKLAEALRQAGFQHVTFTYPVKFYTLGVSARTNKCWVHVDLLDNTQTLVNSVQPTGLLAAKVKLLKKSQPDITHVYVTIDDLERDTNAEKLRALVEAHSLPPTIK